MKIKPEQSLRSKNAQLQKELVAKNRELEIEASLERVRVKAMAMQRSGELADLVTTLFNELTKLDFALTRCAIVIADADDSLGWTIWMANSEPGQLPFSFYRKSFNHPYPNAAYREWKKRTPKWVYHLKGTEKKGMDDYYANSEEVAHMPSVIRQAMDMPESIILSHSFNNFGYLRADSVTPLSEDNLNILYRFAKVFDMCYTRFTDIKQAEAQAREAEIALGLERVRARTMAMQKSGELAETVSLLFKQLLGLGIRTEQIRTCGIVTFDDKKPLGEQWITETNGEIIPQSFIVPYNEAPAYKSIYKAWKHGEQFMVIHLEGKKLMEHLGYLAKGTHVPIRDVVLPQQATEIYNHVMFFSQGCLFIITKEALPEYHDVFKRFGTVFQQSYTRFLDLQKAEAQAREAEIELGLERVRARTMAMQKSGELQEIIKVVHEQLVHLNIAVEHAGFIMDYNTRDDMHIWLADKHYAPTEITVPYFDSPHWNGFNEAKQKGSNFFAIYSGFEEKNKFYQDLFKLIPGVTDETKEYYFSCPGLAISTVLLENVGLYIENFSGTPYTDDENSTLMRFGKVFQQTYTRFKDLEQAEEQAREAQIELGLERVRARAMAMQNSGEINDLIGAVFYELTKLDLVITRCRLWIIDPVSLSCMNWQANQETPAYPLGSFIKYNEQPFYLAILKAWKERSLKLVYELKGGEKKSWDKFLFNETEFSRLPEVVKEGMRSPERVLLSASFGNFGAMQTGSLDPLSDKQMEILSRFVKVFDMSYTRFNDLKQAEAQARESQIQLALERVRARTSAMQKSDELAEVIQVVHDQLYQLDFNINNANFILDYNESDGMNCWAAVQGALYAIKIQIPYYDDTVNNYFNSVKAKGPGLYITTFSAEEKNRFFERIFACNPWMSTERTPLVFGGPGYAWSTVLMKNIALTVQNYSGTPYSDAENEIIKRFGTVFEQTYTRFNDLKQAEEQARESQIQLALERVRARTSAMQKSDELREAIKLIFEQLLQLNFNIDVANFALNCKESDDFNLWLAVHGQQYPTKIHIPYFDHPIFNIFVEAKEKGKDFYAFTCTFEEKNEFFDHFFKNSPEVDEERKEAVYSSPGYAQSTVLMKTISLAIINYAAIPYSEAENMMLKRFGKVFEQTYTRFLDLQRAEAQVREAQVQLALERVRARTMAMHQSIELAETSEVLFQQFAGLGIVPERVVIGIMIENPRKIDLWGTEQGGNKMGVRFELREDWTVGFDKVYNAWEDKKKNLTIVLKDKDLDHHVHYMRDVIGMPMQLELIHQQRVLYAAFFTKGFLMMVANEAEPKETLDILERFAGVFNLTYTRFLDLQKAEEQAREARIETSLERVRSKAMAMRSSEDLADAIGVFYHELGLLSVTPKRCGLGLIDKETRITEISTMNTTEQGDSVEVIGSISLTNHPVLVGIYDNWLLQKEYHPILRGNEIKAYYQLLRPQISYPDYPHDVVQYGYFFFFQDGGVFAWTDTALPEDELQIYRRFNSVLSLTYRRYKDIKDAEAQARESQIQLALERIRARTMAMQKSDELAETAMTLFQQFNELGVKPERIFIGNMDENARTIEFWGTDQGGNQMNPRFEVNADATIGFSQIYKAWKTKKKTHTVIMKGRELADHVRYVQDVLHMPMQPELVQQQRIMYSAFFSKGLLMIVTPEIQSNETIGILERFAGVFDGTYTRFLDLQKAEAQARESQIQLALERVRARTMAMHTSEDVGDTVATMFDELVKLGVEKTVRSGIAIIESAAHMELWTASSSPNEEIALTRGHVNVTIHPLLQGFYNAWKNKEQHFSYELAGDDLKQYYLAMNNSPDYPVHFDTKSLPSKLFHNTFIFPEGAIFIFSSDQLTAEVAQIYKRFAGVFGQTYRRYLDLQKAEAQAREAQIEVALEKVRGKAMAMHNSKDLSSAVSLVFTELKKLGIRPIRCGVGFMTKDPPRTLLYTAAISNDNDTLDLVGWVDSVGHPVLEKIYDSWLKQEDYFPVLNGKELKAYYKKLAHGLHFPSIHDGTSDEKQYGHFLPFPEGMLNAWAERPYSEPELKTLDRFRSIISLTFRRYLDLKKAEEAAREAIKRASLDRVRAEIASMRTIADLDRITPLIWNELTILGVPFIRCGVFIMDEAQEVIHTYLSTPDGKAIAAFQLHFSNDSGNGVNGAALRGWREKQMVTLHWTEEEFRNFSHSLKEQGEIISEESYLTERPPTGLDLHFFPFLQGMLYAGNSAPLSDDDKDLVQSLADAFSTAYARYEDFNRLELAKQEVERTLTDLRTAQTRLIQSEKMASLGELTAGIAHEIQNPLNFVNNFSEVNQDLLEELKAESLKPKAERDEQLEIELINDLINNEQKINHHGKRADGIVKGMLQHSRTAGGEKLPTNINSIAEEYMRLSYHGLRAKDKSFNAEMVTHFDPALPKIEAVGQDIGRVFLNLFNNAFYAVNQKSKTAGENYRPEVTVTTTAFDGQVIITVKDNGVGMPEYVKEKIMQPFFTTKPTGEGTGLGLSLTYDMVVKGHGGSIQVNSVEGEGSEFIITLPIS